jgi:hypothetical protein
MSLNRTCPVDVASPQTQEQVDQVARIITRLIAARELKLLMKSKSPGNAPRPVAEAPGALGKNPINHRRQVRRPSYPFNNKLHSSSPDIEPQEKCCQTIHEDDTHKKTLDYNDNVHVENVPPSSQSSDLVLKSISIVTEFGIPPPPSSFNDLVRSPTTSTPAGKRANNKNIFFQ